jgi:predicted PurR-regulated permease PerM
MSDVRRWYVYQVIREPIPAWLVALLAAGAAVVMAAFWPWIALAIWFGLYARRIEQPIRGWVGGRLKLSAALTVVVLVLLIAPIAAILASLVVDAIALIQQLMQSEPTQAVFEKLVQGRSGAGAGSTNPVDLLMSQGGRAWQVAQQVAGAAARVVIGWLILISGIYGVLVDGPAWYAWIERHAPMQPTTVRRLADAFVETGRGLLFGIVGAGLIQSVIATIAYLVIGVPQALALGLLTLVFSVIPAIGTAIVWVPVAAGLALTGRTGAAIALGVVGVALIGTADNFARPWLARRGKLELPTYVVLVAMFGGIELLGGWGLLLGPLVVRLAKEAVVIRSEARLRAT